MPLARRHVHAQNHFCLWNNCILSRCKAKHNPLENCTIFIASNKLRNKNAFVTWQRCTASSASFGAGNKKSGAFRKTGTNAPPPFPTALSFLFNVLATGFLCFSSPVPASHYKYDEHTAAAPPPLPLIAQAPLLSFAIAKALDHTEGVQSDFVLTDRSQDILVSLLRTEGVLPGEEVEEEENIHHNFALVERWREVSKVIWGLPLYLKY